MKAMVISNMISELETFPKGLVKATGSVGNRRSYRDLTNYYSTKIGQKTEKSPGDLLSLRLQLMTISLC